MGFEVEETLQRLVGMKGVVGGVVMTMAGETIRSTLESTTTSQVSGLMSSLVQMANVRLKDMDPDTELNLIESDTTQYENPRRLYSLLDISVKNVNLKIK